MLGSTLKRVGMGVHGGMIQGVTRATTQRICRRGIGTSIVDNSHFLTEDQVALQTLAEDFAKSELYDQAQAWDAEKYFPEDTLQKAAELGMGGVFVSDEYGGSNLTRLDGSIIFEALAGGCTSTTAYLTIHNMNAYLLNTFGTPEQKEKYLRDLCSMKLFSSYCLTESNSGSDAASLRTVAKRDGDHYILNGEKVFISGGGRSDMYFVMCRTGQAGPGGITCIMVPKDTPGLSYGKQENKLGWRTQPTSAVVFEDCRVPVENRIGDEGFGFKIAMKALDGGRLSIGTCSIGAARRCFDIAREYVQQRQQFGKPLSENQSIQFKLADMATKLHSSRFLLRNAAKMLDEQDPNATAFCAMAKLHATDACFQVCNESLQLLGGYGYLNDYQIERFVRDTRVHQILEGTNEIMRVIMSRQILQR